MSEDCTVTRVICPACGFYNDFTEDEVKSMYQQYKNGYRKNGLPTTIYCGNCSNHGHTSSICEIRRNR